MVEGYDYEITESSPGLWRWVIARPDRVPAGLVNAFVCFETKAEVAQDFAIHASGHLDQSGRWVLPRAHLKLLVQAITVPCEACKDHYFGDVCWHERDADGCNWGVSTIRGPGNHDECMACLEPAAIQLRRRYSVPEEG